MHIVHLNQNPNKGVTISRINRRTKIITGLQVHLGEAVLCLGKEVRLGIRDLRLGEELH